MILVCIPANMGKDQIGREDLQFVFKECLHVGADVWHKSIRESLEDSPLRCVLANSSAARRASDSRIPIALKTAQWNSASGVLFCQT